MAITGRAILYCKYFVIINDGFYLPIEVINNMVIESVG